MQERPQHITLNASHPLANGLVFAGLAPPGLVGSNYYHDASAFGNNGTLTSMDSSNWVWNSRLGRFGTQQNGTDEYVDLGMSGFNPTDFSLSIWCIADAADTTQVYQLIAKGHPWQFFLDKAGYVANAYQFGLWKSDGGLYAYCQSTSVATVGTLTHIAGTVAGTTVQIYVNGVPEGTPSAPSGTRNMTGTANVNVCRRAFGDQYWPGFVADPMVWDRALSLSEIQQLANPSNTLLSGLILPPEPKWWPVAAAAPATTYKPMQFQVC